MKEESQQSLKEGEVIAIAHKEESSIKRITIIAFCNTSSISCPHCEVVLSSIKGLPAAKYDTKPPSLPTSMIFKISIPERCSLRQSVRLLAALR